MQVSGFSSASMSGEAVGNGSAPMSQPGRVQAQLPLAGRQAQEAGAKSINTFTLHVPGTSITQDVCMDSDRSVDDLRAVGSSLLGGKRARIVGLPRAYAGLTLGELKLKAPHRLLVVPSPGSGGRPTAVLEELESVAKEMNRARADEAVRVHNNSKLRAGETSDEAMGGTSDIQTQAMQQSAALGGGDKATSAYPDEHDDDSTRQQVLREEHRVTATSGAWPSGGGTAESQAQAGFMPANRIATSLTGQKRGASESQAQGGPLSLASAWVGAGGAGMGTGWPTQGQVPSHSGLLGGAGIGFNHGYTLGQGFHADAPVGGHKRVDTTTIRSLLLRRVHDTTLRDGNGLGMDLRVPQEFTCALTDVDEEPVLWSDAPAFASRVSLRVRTYQGFQRLASLDPLKKTLVLDIDHTIMDTDLMNTVAMNQMVAKSNQSTTTPSAWRRPHLHEFLTTVYPYYNIVIWSATGNAHVEAKLRDLGCLSDGSGPDYQIALLVDYGAMVRVKVRKGGLERDFNTKPLSVLYGLFGKEGRLTPHTTLLVDDHRRSFVMDPSNGIHIQGYRANEENRRSDREFADLARYCLLVRHLPSVRLLDHDHWRDVAQAADPIQVMANHLRPGFTLHVRKCRDRSSSSTWGAARSEPAGLHGAGRHRSSSSSEAVVPNLAQADVTQQSKAQGQGTRMAGSTFKRPFRVEPIADPLPAEIKLSVRQAGHKKDISDPAQLALLQAGLSGVTMQTAALSQQPQVQRGSTNGFSSPSFPRWPGPVSLPPGVLMPGAHTHTVTGIGEIQAPSVLFEAAGTTVHGGSNAVPAAEVDIAALAGLEAGPYTGSESIGSAPEGVTPAHLYKRAEDELMSGVVGETEPWTAAASGSGPTVHTASPSPAASALSNGSSTGARGSKSTPRLRVPSPDTMLRRFSILQSPGVLSPRRKSGAGLLPLASGAAPVSPVASAAVSAGRSVPSASVSLSAANRPPSDTQHMTGLPRQDSLTPGNAVVQGSPLRSGLATVPAAHASAKASGGHSKLVPAHQLQQLASTSVSTTQHSEPALPTTSLSACAGVLPAAPQTALPQAASTQGEGEARDVDGADGAEPADESGIAAPSSAAVQYTPGTGPGTGTPRSMATAKLAGTGRLDTVHSASIEAVSGQGMEWEQAGQVAQRSGRSSTEGVHLARGGFTAGPRVPQQEGARGQGRRLRRIINRMLSPFQPSESPQDGDEMEG